MESELRKYLHEIKEILRNLYKSGQSAAGTDGGGNPGGGGDASAANQLTEINRLEQIAAKLIATPSTEAKQDAGNAVLSGILAKLIGTPATESKQDDEIAATNALAALLAQVRDKPISIIRLWTVAPIGIQPGDLDFIEGDTLSETSLYSGTTGAVISRTFFNVTQSIPVANPNPNDPADQIESYLTPFGSNQGSAFDAPATSDIGAFTLTSMTKRILARLTTGLTNWTSLLGRIPAALVNGRFPVDTPLPIATPYLFELTGGTVTNVVARAAPARMLRLEFRNLSSTQGAYLKVYNKSTAPVPTTDAALLRGKHYLPPGERVVVDHAAFADLFAAGIAFAITAGRPNTDNTAPATDGLMTIHYA